jgi:hypothetical protein
LCYRLFGAVKSRYASSLDRPKQAALTSYQRAALLLMSRAEAKRPLTSFKEQNTIKQRFCVTKKVTKADPRPLGSFQNKLKPLEAKQP